MCLISCVSLEGRNEDGLEDIDTPKDATESLHLVGGGGVIAFANHKVDFERVQVVVRLLQVALDRTDI
jgi:hypothetical protein